MKTSLNHDQKWISYWLFAGMVMVFIQILLGGVTRLTGSGLSITRWDIVMGSIPPLNSDQWDEAFDLYKITPQYHRINQGMELSEFKFIFYWEFFHRLWARMMGFVFLIPFIFFWIRKSIHKQLFRNLAIVILFAGLAAVFGWIMVASGLVNRPWVNAYKLTVHLSLGILLFVSLFYTWLTHKGFTKSDLGSGWSRAILGLLILGGCQIILGGLVSGMKSALSYPSWPMMGDQWVPSIILDSSHWNVDNLLLYDQSGFMPALVQFMHRNLAYLLVVLIIIFCVKWYRVQSGKWRWIAFFLAGIIVAQVSLGIMTLLNSIGKIPVLYGSLHQSVGIVLITTLFYLHLVLRHENIN